MTRGTLRTRILISTFILALILTFGFFGTYVVSNALFVEEAYNKKNLIRLHILANSNSPADQNLKLEVKDAIIATTGKLFTGVSSPEVARQRVMANRELIRQTALDVIRRRGKDYPVKVVLGRFEFPQKHYGNLTLPPGEYEAVRVVIGKGAGHNWWCVLFPPLCFVEGVGAKRVSAPPDLLASLTGREQVKATDPSGRVGDAGAVDQVVVHWRFKFLDALSHNYTERMADLLQSTWGLRLLAARLPLQVHSEP